MIYLDYSANTPVDPAVLARFCETERAYIGNANSRHRAGRDAAAEQEQVSLSVASQLGVSPEELVFTSGASEANNLAIKGIARALRHIGKHIISTALEHSSVSAPLTWLQEQGYEIDLADIGRDGKIDLNHLRELIRKNTILVKVCAVDSELGTVQPIRELADFLSEYPNCRLHVDATQAVGKAQLCLDGVDTLSLSAHKFYGLNGSGVLFKRKGLVIEPIIHGGASTTIYRSGTPTLALNASLEEALKRSLTHYEQRRKTVEKSNGRLRAALQAYPKVRVNSPKDAVPHILNLSVQGVKGAAFQKKLDEYGICVSVKAACSVAELPSRAVFAVSRDRKNAMASWRVSLSHLTTAEELDAFLEAFDRAYKELTI